ncbi:hypothetical protein A6770_06540 [Nostoc minutum NIES-26]|uniref:Uncharacterized protein n=1 Tax=Nostoc minutum NIES-26 TaxID=1844469 RepID=A0A367Q257_9NOSO|nr:hypothetical protein A6770_06540 [Nostoc minutum NIES-26]
MIFRIYDVADLKYEFASDQKDFGRDYLTFVKKSLAQANRISGYTGKTRLSYRACTVLRAPREFKIPFVRLRGLPCGKPRFLIEKYICKGEMPSFRYSSTGKGVILIQFSF